MIHPHASSESLAREPASQSASADVLTWLVCEPQPRWLRAVRRFGAQALPEPRRPWQVVPVGIPEVRALAVHAQRTVILWELPPDDPQPALAALAACGRRHDQLLQLVGLPLRAGGVADPAHEQATAMALRELGASDVLEDPRELPARCPLIRRFWRRHAAPAPWVPIEVTRLLGR